MPAEVISTNSVLVRSSSIDGAAGVAHARAHAADELLRSRAPRCPCRARGLRRLRAPACRRSSPSPGSSGRRRPSASRRASPCRGRTCRSGPGTARSRRATPRCRRTASRASPHARRRRAPWRCRPSSARRRRRSAARRVLASASATFWMAVICGTPTPATMRVVQIEPGPMPTLTPSAPWSTSAFAPSPVATLPPMTSIFGSCFLIHFTRSSTPCAWPCAVSTTSTSTPASTSAATRSSVPSPTPTAAPTRSLPCASLQAFGCSVSFRMSLHRDQALQLEVVVDHQHALEAVLVHELHRLFAARAFAHRDQLVAAAS